MENGQVDVSTKSYDSYKYKNKRYTNYATDKEYKKILSEFFKELIIEIATSGALIELPSKLGAFEIVQYNTDDFKESLQLRNKKFRLRDFGAMNKLKKEKNINTAISPNNELTNGCWWLIKWKKAAYCNFSQRGNYKFELVRSNIRATSNKKYAAKANRFNITEFYREKGYEIYREIDYRPLINKYKALNKQKEIDIEEDMDFINES